MTQTREWQVIRMGEAHLFAVANLERECFPEPWSERALAMLLGENAIGFVAWDGETVLGYGGMLIASDEGQITNIAVCQDARRRGVGASILAEIIAECKRRDLSEISLEVRVSNEAAKHLYESFGFASAGIRKRFYRHPPEDAVVMIRKNQSKTEGQNRESC